MRYINSILVVLISLNAFGINPERDYKYSPDQYKLNYKNVKISTIDKFEINCWIIHPESSIDKKISIVLAYPDAGNMSYYLYHASMLANSGFTVVLFDYRGFGKSSDFLIDNKMLYYNEFATDLISVIKWTKINIKNNRIGVYGLSMGTIIATIASKTEPIDFMIGEGYVCSPLLIKDKYKKLYHKEILLPTFSDKYPELLDSIKTRMLIFVGRQDEITTVNDANLLISQNKNRQLIAFDGKHLEGMWKLTNNETGDIYFSKITDFLKE